MLSGAIGELLPYAAGVALSPIPIVAVVLMLDTRRGRANGVAFSVGWIVGLVAVSVVVLVVTGGSDDSGSTTATTVDWVKLLLGGLFHAMAVRQWRGRLTAGQEAEMPAWMPRVDPFSPVQSLGLGLALSAANPKNLALAAAAGAAIAQSGVDAADDVIAVAVFVVLASVTVVGLVVASLVGGSRVAGFLEGVRTFMAQHNAVIMMVILIVLGAKLIGSALPGVA